MEELLKRADFVSLHVPADPSTRLLMDESMIAKVWAEDRCSRLLRLALRPCDTPIESTLGPLLHLR